MLNKLKAFFCTKNKQTEINRQIASKLHNMHVKYISEKDENGVDTIIGRSCHINILGEKGDELCASCGIQTVFRLNISEMHIWEFMSLDGCVIRFTDLDTGAERNVTVYYDKHLT